MGNAFRRFGALGTVVSAALFVCSACSGTPDEEATSEGPPPYQGSLTPLPNPPAANTPAPSDGMQPAGATAPINEGPAANNNTPVAPPVQMAGGATPPQQTPPAMTPPAMTPPAQNPMPMNPPIAGVDPNFFIFLLIGQSNMEGVPPSEAQDRTTNPRIRVLALNNCQQRNQVYNQWYTATPSLHTCAATLGPGDYFARTLVDALPGNVTIGLVPDAIAGVNIDTFRKGIVSSTRGQWFYPPDNQRNSAYETVVERAKLAQQSGVIKGIIFHQGESDSGQMVWLDKVKDMLDDLKADLNLPANLPFMAGELLYSGCCRGHNSIIGMLPGRIPGAAVISANGLNAYTADGGMYHFDTPGQRELGRRYGQAMLGALGL